MRKRRKNTHKTNFKTTLSLLILLALTIATYISDLEPADIVSSSNVMLDNTKVFFIDVGQGDASLIMSGESVILIDAGKNSGEEAITEFLSEQGVSKIDLIIGTHAHEDHIGGIDAVIENFDVEILLMPDVPSNTITYEDVITAVNDYDVSLISPYDQQIFEFDSGLVLEVLLPPSSFESDSTNDDSIVCEVTIGDTVILYTGDMEAPLEEAMLPYLSDIDILKVGHHGSYSSSTEAFLDIVKPEIAVISCGVNNSYGHPHDVVMDRLNERDIEIRRTDLEGDILFEFENVA